MLGAEFSTDSSEEEALRSATVEKGKTQWDLIHSKSKMPHYGTCWQKALGQVEAGCKNLNEDQQARLSLALVGCQMDQLGIRRKSTVNSDGTIEERPYDCSADIPLKDCTQGLNEDVNAFTAFSQFFTHTAHICYFLESQRWRETTKMTVETLLRSSDVVARGLNVSTKMQEKLISSQEELLSRGANLSKSLESSSAGVQRLFEEFRASTENQRLMIRDTIAQVVELRSFIVDQVGLFYSYVFYVAALIVATLITATKRTGGARVWLYVILTLNLVAERLFLYYVDKELVHLYSAHEISDLVVVWAWRCRQTTMGLGAGILLWKIFTYRDILQVHGAILKEIQMQNASLKSQLDQLSAASSKHGSSPSKVISADVTLKADQTSSGDEAQHDSIFSRVGSKGRASFFFPGENSTFDATFVGRDGDGSFSDSRSEDDDDDDTASLESSSGRSSRTELLTRSSTPHDPRCPPSTSSSSSFLSASFAAAGNSFASSASAMASSVGSTLSGMMEELRSLSPPGIKSDNSAGHNGRRHDGEGVYNLRPRSRSSLFSSQSAPSSAVGVALRRGVEVIQDETPEEFGDEVKRMWNVSRRNARKVKSVVNASNVGGNLAADVSGLGCFSSDDE